MADDQFIDLGFPDNADPALKLQRALDLLADAIGYAPGGMDPLRAVLERCAEFAADNESMAVNVARAIVRWIGERLYGVTFDTGIPATATIVVTASAATGGDITADVTEVSISGVSFIATTSATLAAGASATVTFQAAEAGTANNGLFDTPQSVTSDAWVATWTLSTPTANGTDEETDDEYEAKVVRKIRTIGRPILAEDFQARAVDWPGVGRALVLDGYNADTLATGQDATETIAVVDPAGEALSSPTMDALAASIAAEREVGWKSFVIAPTYTTVDVRATASVWPGFDPAGTVTSGETALTDYLDPASFGNPPTGETIGWSLETEVQYEELVTALNDAVGVHRVESLLFGAVKAATAVASTDLFTSTAHGYAAGDTVEFTNLTGGAGITAGTAYYVIASGLTADNFKVSTTLGGSALNVTSDLTAGKVRHFGSTDVPLPGPAPLTRPGTITVTAV